MTGSKAEESARSPRGDSLLLAYDVGVCLQELGMPIGLQREYAHMRKSLIDDFSTTAPYPATGSGFWNWDWDMSTSLEGQGQEVEYSISNPPDNLADVTEVAWDELGWPEHPKHQCQLALSELLRLERDLRDAGTPAHLVEEFGRLRGKFVQLFKDKFPGQPTDEDRFWPKGL
jgi:hypothetical protein